MTTKSLEDGADSAGVNYRALAGARRGAQCHAIEHPGGRVRACEARATNSSSGAHRTVESQEGGR